MEPHRNVRLNAAAALAVLLLPAVAHAAGSARLTIQQIELTQKNWPKARAYVSLVGPSGSPVPGQGIDTFKIYEDGNKSPSRLQKVDSLETSGAGASIVVVLQASGAMSVIKDDLKKAVAAFINGLSDKDQVAVVAFAEAADAVAAFTADKGDAAGKVNKIEFAGKNVLLYDGLSQALQLFAPIAPRPGAKAADTGLPVAKAIVLVADGRDFGSATDVEKFISDASKRKVPVHVVGHAELDQDTLRNLEDLAQRTGGSYHPASTEDISKKLVLIKENIGKLYVLDWNTSLSNDGKEHSVQVTFEVEGVPPSKSEMKIKTPDFINWMKIGIIAGAILLALIIVAVIYVVTRPKPPPQRFCPVCKRVQMPEWDICLFCLKAAKGRLLVQKGAQKGKMFPLVGKIVNIGSGPENGIRLMDGAISGKHAGVAIDDTKFEIVDLGSKNGVLVNGKKTPRRFLRNGDIITLGMTELKFETTAKTGGDDDEDAAED